MNDDEFYENELEEQSGEDIEIISADEELDIKELSEEEEEMSGGARKVKFVWKNGGGLHGTRLRKTISFSVSGSNLKITRTSISRKTNKYLKLDKVWRSGNKIYAQISRDNWRRRGWLDFYVYATTSSMSYQFLVENWCD